MARKANTGLGTGERIRRPRVGGKVALLCEQIKAMAVKHGPGAKLPTALELCNLFDTAPSSLNAALKELEQQQVIDRRWGVGIFVSPYVGRKSVRVLIDASLIHDSGGSPFWGLLLGLCLSEAQHRTQDGGADYRFQIVTSVDGALVPPDLLEDVLARRLDGIISIGVCGTLPPSVGSELPLVSYGGDGHWHVGADYRQYVQNGVAALCDQGCRRLEMWLPTETHTGRVPLGDEYRELFQKELVTHGLDREPSVVRDLPTHKSRSPHGSYQQQGYLLARDVFSRHTTQRPDGLLILDDMMTAGALFAMGEFGIRANRDVQVATIANQGSSVLFGYEKSLTLIEISPQRLAVALFETLDILMAGETPAQAFRFVAPQTRMPFEA